MAKKAWGRLLLPFAIWSVLYSGISIALDCIRGETVDWLGYMGRFAIGQASTPFYYIVVLMQLSLITPWIVRTLQRHGILSRLLWFVTPAYLIYVYWWNFQFGTEAYLYSTFFPAWFGFYYFGIYVACRRNNSPIPIPIDRVGKGYMLFSTLLLSCLETFILRAYGATAGMYTSQITVGSFLYTFVVICFFLSHTNERKETLLTRVGDASYGIFYVHMFVLMIALKAVEIAGWNRYWLASWSIPFFITISISYAVVRGAQTILRGEKGHKLLLWLGFI